MFNRVKFDLHKFVLCNDEIKSLCNLIAIKAIPAADNVSILFWSLVP